MKTETVKIASLTLDPANVRKHDDRNLEAIKGSLNRFGQQKPIVVGEDNVVIAGNGTVQAAKALGWTEINIVRTKLAGADRTAFAIADNRTAELAAWDDDALAQTLASLQTQDEELARMTGFSDDEIAKLINEVVGVDDVQEDEAPAVPETPVTRPGDLWLLGEHRVLCGDATSIDHLSLALNGKLASMCFTDPPYNVDYTGKTSNALKIKGDKMSGDSFLQFLRDAFSAIHASLDAGSVVYVCHADSEGQRFRQAFVEAGLELKQCLVWVKNSLVLGRQDYHWRHEPILYGWKPGAAHRFYGGRKNTTVIESDNAMSVDQDGDQHQRLTIHADGRTLVIRVPSYEVLSDGTDEGQSAWRIDRPTRNAEHPTMKPVRLCARGIVHGSKQGDIVLEPFMGSGSTLMACDQLLRACCGTELDPRYCDVVVQRWQKFTGKLATLDGDGRTFDELAKERVQ